METAYGNGSDVFKSLDAERSVALIASIRARTARVAVIGLGRTGLPLAVANARAGFAVTGIDNDAVRVAQIAKGMNYLRYLDDADVAALVARGRLRATTEIAAVRDAEIVAICIPIELGADKTPDFDQIRTVVRALAKHLRPGQLLCLEAATYPGMTFDVLLPALAESGLLIGADYFLAIAPERYDPGNRRFDVETTTRIVSGVTPACIAVAAEFYRQTTNTVKEIADPRVAEMSKVFENTFRAVNIAFVNEMALLCDAMKLNVWDVIDAADSKPFGHMRFEPGPGVGGLGIPHDPHYLAWMARRHNVQAHFVELAGEINRMMPAFVCQKVTRALNAGKRAIAGAKVLVLGVAYKRDVAEMLESPALAVIAGLERAGAEVSHHDPLVPSFRDAQGGLHANTPLSAEVLEAADCVVILTDHTSIDWRAVVDHSSCVVDTRNATRHVRGTAKHVLLL